MGGGAVKLRKAAGRLERRRAAYDGTDQATNPGRKRPGSFKKPAPKGARS